MSRLTKMFSISLFFMLLISIISFDIDHFVDNKLISKWHVFILISITGGLCLLFERRSIIIEKISFSIIILFFYILTRGYSSEMPIIETSILLSFFVLYVFFQEDLIPIKITNQILIIVSIVLAMYGILQYTQILPTKNEFRILGSYDNPAGLAANLSFTFPLLFSFINRHKLLFSIIALLLSFTVVLTESRAGMLSITIVCGIYFYDNFPYRLKNYKRPIMWGTIIVSLLCWLYLYSVKQDSAIGRTLIWLVSSNVVFDNIFFGQGSYGFFKEYMIHQAEYFTKYPDSPYNMLAGNIMHTFNEYLLVIIKYGLLAILIIIYVFYLLFKNVRISTPYLLCIISIGVFALFSYPFQYPITWVILIYSIARITKSDKSTKPFFSIPIGYSKLIILSLISISCFLLVKDSIFEYRWHKIAKQSLEGQTKEVLPEYKKLYQSWNGNHLFLYNYASELSIAGENKESLNVLDYAIRYWNDYDIQLLFADNYVNLKELKKAKQHYYLASKMCPNRFIPLYGLLKIYEEEKDRKMIISCAEKILEKKIKVPSPTINFIKQEAQNLLKNYPISYNQ